MALLFIKVQFVTGEEMKAEERKTPPPQVVAVFESNRQLVILVTEKLAIPPPSLWLLLFEKVQFSKYAFAPSFTLTPPPE